MGGWHYHQQELGESFRLQPAGPNRRSMPTKATKRPSPSAVGVKRPSQQGSGACYLTLFAFILPLIFLIGLKIAQFLGYNTQIL